ncbi:DedA family protein [Streptomyces sp. NPDC016309]|uniref:DedA family protein n=1 Tax=Streptomyces sp. NPDC016309 TaxID=3364965 RepID=UPI0037013227
MAAGPWIYTAVAVSVLLDVFLPVLPSGILVITAATVAATGSGSLLALTLCAATASLLGDLVAYGLAWRGRSRLHRMVARSRRLATAHERLGAALAQGGGLLVVIARFAPAGRSVVSLGAGAARRKPGQFVPWSALAGLAWASYGVGLGYFGGRWVGATWTGVAVSVVALFLAGTLAAYVMRRPPAPSPGTEASRAPAAGTEPPSALPLPAPPSPGSAPTPVPTADRDRPPATGAVPSRTAARTPAPSALS